MVAPEVAPSEHQSSEPLSDAEVIALAQAGDHAAFEVIFNQYHTQIFNYIYRVMGDASDANDMTQDAFLKMWLGLPRTNEDLRFGAWAYRVATNVCLDELRHRKLVKWQTWDAFISVFHSSQVSPAREQPEHQVTRNEDREEVQLLLNRLRPQYRLALLLREYRDLSYDEIAQVLSTTRAAVKSLLYRAREEFRQCWARRERELARETTDEDARAQALMHARACTSQIMQRLDAGETYAALARDFGIPTSSLWSLVRGARRGARARPGHHADGA